MNNILVEGYHEINEMKNLIFEDVFVNKDKTEITFRTSKNDYIFYHDQDYCEDVYIEDIVGNLSDLTGLPIIKSEYITQVGDSDWGTQTHTFYNFATIKGLVTIRWYGESNGFYSEEVDLKIKKRV